MFIFSIGYIIRCFQFSGAFETTVYSRVLVLDVLGEDNPLVQRSKMEIIEQILLVNASGTKRFDSMLGMFHRSSDK